MERNKEFNYHTKSRLKQIKANIKHHLKITSNKTKTILKLL